MSKLQKMKELVEKTREAAFAYYSLGKEIMTDHEYDKLYDQLLLLEKETGIVLAGSPTTFAGFEVVGSLEKIDHEFPALSLEKTKNVEELKSWLGNNEGALSWKLDGLTAQISYDAGHLSIAALRGNGHVGEKLITAGYFRGLPQLIPYQGHLVVRGEALITYEEFERINQSIDADEDKYKNPRNLASGTIRQLDSRICAERTVDFFGFELVYPEPKTFLEGLSFLEENGFQVVDHIPVNASTLEEEVERYKSRMPNNPFPSDGLVLAMNDVGYGKGLSSSSKSAPGSKAFKWQDTEVSTILRDIEWSAGRTGALTPVAIFDPIELEGTTVTRASVHNLSTIRKLQLGIGDEILVMKANMIIPQISDNLTRSDTVKEPEICPVCKGKTQLRYSNDTVTVTCPDSGCAAKNLYAFVHFVGRDAMNIDGLSESKLERLIAIGALSCFADLYDLEMHKEQICAMEGFGEKSYANLVSAIDASRSVHFQNFLYALGIPNVGRTASKKIGAEVRYSFGELRNRIMTGKHFDHLEGIGPLIDKSLFDWFQDLSKNETEAENLAALLKKLDIQPPKGVTTHPLVTQKLNGLTFAITGKLVTFPNRDTLVEYIECMGGRVVSSVTAGTDYLINNDIHSQSSKNKAALAMGKPIITEADLRSMAG